MNSTIDRQAERHQKKKGTFPCVYVSCARARHKNQMKQKEIVNSETLCKNSSLMRAEYKALRRFIGASVQNNTFSELSKTWENEKRQIFRYAPATEIIWIWDLTKLYVVILIFGCHRFHRMMAKKWQLQQLKEKHNNNKWILGEREKKNKKVFQ